MPETCVNLDSKKPVDALRELLEIFVGHVGTVAKAELALDEVLGEYVARRSSRRHDADRRIGMQKDPVIRSARYLAYVRMLPCAGCDTDAPSEPHHIEHLGMGIKGSDYACVPTCRRCHDSFHVGKDPQTGIFNPKAIRETLLVRSLACLSSYARTMEGV